MVRWLKAGISIFVVGAVLELLLAAVALARIESPTSWTWATLNILAILLLFTGSLAIYTGKAKQRENKSAASSAKKIAFTHP